MIHRSYRTHHLRNAGRAFLRLPILIGGGRAAETRFPRINKESEFSSRNQFADHRTTWTRRSAIRQKPPAKRNNSEICDFFLAVRHSILSILAIAPKAFPEDAFSRSTHMTKQTQIHFSPRSILGALAAVALLALAPGVDAQRLGLPGAVEVATGSWQRLVHQPPFHTDTALLLTDGTVMVHQDSSPSWWRLTPDNTGGYLNGTWSQLGSMRSTYGPLYFASAVLPDGRVIVEGGEYNFGSPVESTDGAIYDPVTNVWTQVNPPVGWSTIGDSPGIVLADGTFMMGQAGSFSTRQVLFNASTLTWTAVGTGKADAFAEEGFALLPNRSILTIDAENGTNSEAFDPATHHWSSAGSTIVLLPDPGSLEIGPMIQRPDGTVIGFGGLPHTSILNTATGTWTPGPDFPGGNDMADAPASILPDGNILVFTSPGVFNTPGTFFVFDGISFTQAPSTQSAPHLTSYQGRMLLLPTGQVLSLVADGGTIDVELYTSQGQPNPAWAPTITSVPLRLRRGRSYQIFGTQFNGFSCGADYGDDAAMASNYPLVRITNNATGHVFYARTHDHSTMAIATGQAIVSTTFDVAAGVEAGPSTIAVVANGIASRKRRVIIAGSGHFLPEH